MICHTGKSIQQDTHYISVWMLHKFRACSLAYSNLFNQKKKTETNTQQEFFFFFIHLEFTALSCGPDTKFWMRCAFEACVVQYARMFKHFFWPINGEQNANYRLHTHLIWVHVRLNVRLSSAMAPLYNQRNRKIVFHTENCLNRQFLPLCLNFTAHIHCRLVSNDRDRKKTCELLKTYINIMFFFSPPNGAQQR